MIEIFSKHQDGIIQAFLETTLMLFYSGVVALVFSLPLGILLYALNKDFLIKNKILYQILSIILNILRSIPFLIFIFVLIPVNRFIFKTGFGTVSATLPLSLVGISLLTRFIEQALLNVDKKIIDRSIVMGANKLQIIYYFLLPSIKQDIILSFTSVLISILSYSTVMGVIGAGGLGDYAYRYGYQEYDYPLMYLIILIFVIYVFIIQNIGYFLTNHNIVKRRKNL